MLPVVASPVLLVTPPAGGAIRQASHDAFTPGAEGPTDKLTHRPTDKLTHRPTDKAAGRLRAHRRAASSCRAAASRRFRAASALRLSTSRRCSAEGGRLRHACCQLSGAVLSVERGVFVS